MAGELLEVVRRFYDWGAEFGGAADRLPLRRAQETHAGTETATPEEVDQRVAELQAADKWDLPEGGRHNWVLQGDIAEYDKGASVSGDGVDGEELPEQKDG